MASFVRRAMVYLGLVDDDYDEYEQYEEPAPAPPRSAARAHPMPEPEPVGAMAQSSGTIRTLHRDDPMTAAPARPAVVRPITPLQGAKVHVVAPGQFPDAQEIGDRLKASQPVIVNLQGADRELARRMIDFCSGATYALGGSMDKVAEQVFLLTPSNVEVSAEEKRRLQERGLYRS
ncbi:MAG TPA: cell division protein SepF [Acidimicrobiales bacterium]|nr:cell division protein SepF [Acidimicrobiales bacterium]